MSCQNSKSTITVVKASAGSGKTYNLSRTYINLFKNYVSARLKERGSVRKKLCGKQDVALIDNDKQVFFDSIDSVIAITFTNKAAAEMRSRVIAFLKDIIEGKKGEKEGFEIDKSEALFLLCEILENFSDFQLTTIDSFMNRIFKAFAVELNVYPDYDITFEKEELFNLAVEEFFHSSEAKNVVDFLRVLLEVEKEGFDGERIIRNALKKYKDEGFDLKRREWELAKTYLELENIKKLVLSEIDRYVEGTEFKDITEKFKNISSIRDLLNSIEDLAGRVFDSLKGVVDRVKDRLNKNKIKWLNKRSVFEIKMDSAFWEYNGLDSLKKKDKEFEDKDVLDYSRLHRLIVKLIEIHFILKAAYEGKTIEVFFDVVDKEWEIKRSLNIVEGGNITAEVKKIIGDFVSYAFCVLGERIVHYLIDEFQDTSDIQFEAMCPLIENALSKGGSLYVVGDKKQAIYGWRGGDYRVFDKLKHNESSQDSLSDCDLSRIASLEEKSIRQNFRSAKAIVEFNNNLFGFKEDDGLLNFVDTDNSEQDRENWVNHIATFLVNSREKEKLKEVVAEIKNVFSHAKQEAVSEQRGFVSVKICKYGDIDKEEVESDFLKKEFFSILDNVLDRYNQKDIMVLARSKDDLHKIAEYIFEYCEDREKKVDFITEDTLALINNTEIKKLLLIALFCVNPNDRSVFQSLGEIDVFPIKSKKDFFNAVSGVESSNNEDLFYQVLKDFCGDDFFRMFKEIVDSASLYSPYEFFMYVISRYNRFFEDKESEDSSFGFDIKGNAAYFDRFFEAVLKLEERFFSLKEVVEYFYENKDITLSMPESIDAIRLMTIHKAKGLEAEVVIVPFYNWQMISRNSNQIVDMGFKEWFKNADEDARVFVKLNKQLRIISEKAEYIYFQKRLREFIETLNLMYVANTRPKKELFIRGAVKTAKDDFNKLNKRFITSAHVLLTILKANFFALNEFESKKWAIVEYSSGEREEKGFEHKESLDKASVQFFPETVRESFGVLRDEVYFENRERVFGNLFHLIMSFIGKAENRDIEDIVESAYEKAVSVSGFDLKEFQGIKLKVRECLDDLIEYFNGIDSFWNEKEIISSSGYIFRIDRLVKKGDFYTVIDYKTGKKEEKHINQVRDYVRELNRWGLKTDGVIYYTDTRERVNVSI